MDEATKRYSNGSIKNETSNTNQYSMLGMKSQSNDVSENESFNCTGFGATLQSAVDQMTGTIFLFFFFFFVGG